MVVFLDRRISSFMMLTMLGIIIVIRIKNIGRGPAINLSVTLNGKRRYIGNNKSILGVAETAYFVFALDEYSIVIDEENYANHVIFDFEDLNEHKYQQVIEFGMRRINQGKIALTNFGNISIDMKGV